MASALDKTSDFKPIKIPFSAGTDGETRFKRYLRDRIKSIRSGLNTLQKEKIVTWRRAYEAIPAEATREFPWHGASNLVVPVIAIHTDTLLARVMSAVMKTRPLWTTRIYGDPENAISMRSSFEEFMQYVGSEPTELDIYRVYHEFFFDIICYGTGVVKTPWFKQVLDSVAPSGDGQSSKKFEYVRKTVYEGPRPEKVAFERFGINPSAKTCETADFKYDIVTLDKYDLEERRFLGHYDKAAVDAVLAQPDRIGSVDFVQSQKEQDSGARTQTWPGAADYDIFECHFRYRVDETHFCKCIASYHPKSDTLLRAYFNYYPDEVYIAGRLFYRSDSFHGQGFAEILWPFQEEISQIHNARRDNSTIANLKMFRVDPESVLNKGYKIYSGAMLPGKKDEIEELNMGTPVQGEIDSERLSLELAEKRSGVSPPMQGAGAGSNTKRGVYTAMGTLSLLQEGNTRTDLNISDVRYAHTKLGRVFAQHYAKFGIGERDKMFGKKKGGEIRQALTFILDGSMALPIYASTSSINREVEKQNDLMLKGISDKHFATMTQMLQSSGNAMLSPEIKKYITDAMKASNELMQTVYRHFGFDEADRLAPEPEAAPVPPQAQQSAGAPAPGSPAAAGPTPGAPSGGLPPGSAPALPPGGAIQ